MDVECKTDLLSGTSPYTPYDPNHSLRNLSLAPLQRKHSLDYAWQKPVTQCSTHGCTEHSVYSQKPKAPEQIVIFTKLDHLFDNNTSPTMASPGIGLASVPTLEEMMPGDALCNSEMKTPPTRLNLSVSCDFPFNGDSKKRGRVATPPAVSPKWSLKPRCKRAARQPWSADEDKRLREAVKQLGKARNWRTIAENFVKSRSASQCSQRWHKTVRPELQHVKRGTWSDDEDAKLRQLVEEHTSIHGGNLLGIWNGISRDMGFGRNPKQCRERWTHFLDPALKIGEWSMHEDHKLMQLYDEQGRKWSAIAKELPGRTAGRVKRRAESLLRDRVRCIHRAQL